MWPTAAAARASSDVAILNFALALEYLQASFYTEAERIGALHGAVKHQAEVVGAHERAHVKAFKQLLGGKAIKEPRFNFHGVTESQDAFRRTAVAFEDLAVAAYKGQAPMITSRSYLAGAIGIHSVEARHAAWIRRLAGFLPAAKAFDDPLDAHHVVEIVNSTHFVDLGDRHHQLRGARMIVTQGQGAHRAVVVPVPSTASSHPASPHATQTTARLTVSPASLSLGGGSTGQVALSAAGGSVSWTASTSAAGVSARPAPGQLAAGHSATVTVTVQRQNGSGGGADLQINGAQVSVTWAPTADPGAAGKTGLLSRRGGVAGGRAARGLGRRGAARSGGHDEIFVQHGIAFVGAVLPVWPWLETIGVTSVTRSALSLVTCSSV